MPIYSEIYKTANHEGDLFLTPSFTILGVSFVILTVVDLISGLLPAIRASKLNPVEALRHE
ncbi:MAG: hypothetical protein JSS87_13895 [Acidobacteria bacterium]|nr:hypothetical protein [Acidobacteriota bacterium]